MEIPINLDDKSMEMETLFLLDFVEDELSKMLTGQLADEEYIRTGYVLVAILKVLIMYKGYAPPKYIQALWELDFVF